MIIVAIIAMAAVVITALYAVLSALPPLPDSIFTVVNYCVGYLGQGASLLFAFVYGGVGGARVTVAEEKGVVGG